MRKVVCCFLVLASFLLLAGCGPKPEPAPDAGGDSGPIVGGTLVVGDSWSVVNLDPALYNDEGSWHVINLVFDALVAHDPDRKIIPRLATSWENPDVYKRQPVGPMGCQGCNDIWEEEKLQRTWEWQEWPGRSTAW